jgi:hypothetical protein
MISKPLDDIRVYLSRKYLDCAENLPQSRWGVVQRLKDIREHQRRVSENEYKESRIPQGMEIDYLYFRLIEMFHVEEFDNLQKCLIELLPELEDNYRNRHFSTQFREFARTIAGGGFISLGCIYRDVKGRVLFKKSFREIKALPSEIDFVVVSLHKILPSAFFVTFDVHLNREATGHLLQLQEEHYLPKLRFFRLAPWKVHRSGYSEESVEMVRIQEIFRWIDKLRSGVEECIKPFISGYFMAQTTHAKPHLPLIEVYGIKGLPEGIDAFQTWRKGAWKWSESLGFHFHFDIFGDEKVLFTRPRYGSTFGYPAYRLIVLWEQYLHTIRPDDLDGGRSAIKHDVSYTLDAILACVAIDEFLRSAQRNVETLRQDIYGKMRNRFLPLFKMNRLVRLNNIVKQESMILERIAMEFEQEWKFIHHEMEPIKALNAIENHTKGREVRNLRDLMMESIRFRINLIRKHFSLVANSFSEYVALRNMEATYRLQRSIFWLTIIVAVATVIGLAANWSTILTFSETVVRSIVGSLFTK